MYAVLWACGRWTVAAPAIFAGEATPVEIRQQVVQELRHQLLEVQRLVLPAHAWRRPQSKSTAAPAMTMVLATQG